MPIDHPQAYIGVLHNKGYIFTIRTSIISTWSVICNVYKCTPENAKNNGWEILPINLAFTNNNNNIEDNYGY